MTRQKGESDNGIVFYNVKRSKVSEMSNDVTRFRTKCPFNALLFIQ